MVHVAYAGLPKVGDVLFEGLGGQCKYVKTRVTSLYSNFVELKALQPTDQSAAAPIRVERGTAFNIILSPLDDRVLNVRVLAVGEIRGKQEGSTKYRAAVVQRRCGFDTVWGPLETLDAAALPDLAHCEVHRTQTLTDAQPRTTHLFCKHLSDYLKMMMEVLCMLTGADGGQEGYRSRADQDGLRGVHAHAPRAAEETTGC
jgi:hypothetical protein